MTTRAFLNVTQSLTGRRWVGPGIEADRQAEAMEALETAILAKLGIADPYGDETA